MRGGVVTIVPAEAEAIEPTAVVPPSGDGIPARIDPGVMPADRNPYWVYLAQRQAGESRRTMQGCLDRIAELFSPTREPGESPAGSGASFPWWQLEWRHAALLKAIMVERGHSVSHINKNLSAFRVMMKTSRRLGLMTHEQGLATADIDNEKVRSRLPAGRNLADEEITAMLATCLRDPSAVGVRDAAIIAVLRSTGARRVEVTRLTAADFDTAERTLRITGKGGKVRECYLTDVAVLYLSRWLAFAEIKNGPLLRPCGRWDIVEARPLNAWSVSHVVEVRSKEAGLRPCTTHDFRRTFAGDLLDAGVDLVTVQELLGHSDPVTTSRYDRRPARGRRAAVDKLRLPRPEEVLAALEGGLFGSPAAREAGQ